MMLAFPFRTKRLLLNGFSILAILFMMAIPLKAEEITQNKNSLSSSDLPQSGQEKIQAQDYRGAILDLSQSILLDPQINVG